MSPLSASDILRVWELGQGRHPVDRALLFLALAYPEKTRDELAGLRIGQRDACLLALYQRTFAAAVNGFAACPQCGERLEFTVKVADLLVTSPAVQDEQEQKLMFRRTDNEGCHSEPERSEGEESRPTDGLTRDSSACGLRMTDPHNACAGVLKTQGFAVHFRLLNSWDLAAVASCENTALARRLLAQRCVLQVVVGGAVLPPAELPDDLLASLAQCLADCDPQAELLFELACPACGHHWMALFDIESFLWAEIRAQAKRLFREVHILAQAYGWRESEILSMSTPRRQMYLEMVS